MHLLVNYTYKAISRVCHKLFAGRHFLPVPLSPCPDHLPFPRSDLRPEKHRNRERGSSVSAPSRLHQSRNVQREG